MEQEEKNSLFRKKKKEQRFRTLSKWIEHYIKLIIIVINNCIGYLNNETSIVKQRLLESIIMGYF